MLSFTGREHSKEAQFVHGFQQYFAEGRDAFMPDDWFHFENGESRNEAFSRFLGKQLVYQEEIEDGINTWINTGVVKDSLRDLKKFYCYARFDAALTFFSFLYSEVEDTISSPFSMTSRDGRDAARRILIDWWSAAGIHFYFMILQVRKLDGAAYTFFRP